MRKSGYYWVRVHKTWWVAQYLWVSGVWLLFGNGNHSCKDSDFDEIDERKIERNEN